jgi:hypothetical protein
MILADGSTNPMRLVHCIDPIKGGGPIAFKRDLVLIATCAFLHLADAYDKP